MIMEFHEKLLKLRQQKGLTQEELSQALYVSRTAISKWESGRGYPNIESLKAIAKFFGITLDQLLSGEELLTIAEADTKQKQSHLCDLVFGMLDCSILLFLFLPLLSVKSGGTVLEGSLISLAQLTPYLKFAYYAVVIGSFLIGILLLAFQNPHFSFWTRSKYLISLGWNMVGVIIFVISLQPYAAIFLFVFLGIKGILLAKKP